MSFITASRLATLIIIILAALVTLGITIHFIVLESTVPDGFTSSLIFPLVVAVLGVLIAPIFILVGLVRTKAWLTMIVVEFPTLGVLFILWIAFAAMINNSAQVAFPLGCTEISFEFEFDSAADIQALQGICREFSGLAAAGFIAAIFTLVYLLVLSAFIAIGKNRGNTIWYTSVAEADFFKQNNVEATNMQYGMTKPSYTSSPNDSNVMLAVPMMNGVPIGPPVQMPAQQMMSTGSTQQGMGMGMNGMSGTQTQMQMGYSMNAQV